MPVLNNHDVKLTVSEGDSSPFPSPSLSVLPANNPTSKNVNKALNKTTDISVSVENPVAQQKHSEDYQQSTNPISKNVNKALNETTDIPVPVENPVAHQKHFEDDGDAYHFLLALLTPVALDDVPDSESLGCLTHPAVSRSNGPGLFSRDEVLAAAGPHPTPGPLYSPQEALELSTLLLSSPGAPLSSLEADAWSGDTLSSLPLLSPAPNSSSWWLEGERPPSHQV